jgi:hypothetical protein
MCLAGASGAGADLLAALPDAPLHTYYVWVPMLHSDNETAARAASALFAEPRAKHYWDGERHLSRHLATALAINTRRSAAPGDDPPFAWDVYLAYERGNAEIDAPDFWMHQLAIDHAPRFDPGEWRRLIGEMLSGGVV